MGTKGKSYYNGLMKLACFDVDGTLLPNYKDPIPQPNIDAVQRFADLGNAIAIASGRPFGSCKKFLDCFKSDKRFVIAAGGSVAYDYDGNLLWKKTLSKEDFLHFRKELSKCKDVGVYCYIGDDSMGSYFPEPWAKFEYDINTFSCHHDLNQGLEAIDEFGVTKIMITSSIEVSKSIVFEPEDYEKYTIVRSSPNFLEVMPKGVSKASGAYAICKKLGIKKEDVYAFGDSGNDIGMIQEFEGVAMGNAMKEVKAVAKYVTKSCVDCGVAYALKDILHLI